MPRKGAGSWFDTNHIGVGWWTAHRDIGDFSQPEWTRRITAFSDCTLAQSTGIHSQSFRNCRKAAYGQERHGTIHSRIFGENYTGNLHEIPSRKQVEA